MIKINLTNFQKRKIEDLIWEDAKTSETGIIKQLEINEKIIKEKYNSLYSLLYTSGKQDEEKIKKLLFAQKADRDTDEYFEGDLEWYIEKLGIFDGSKEDDILKQLFDYKHFSTRKVIKQILRIMNVDVCPYCNRQYIFTLEDKNVRAQLDHYYPKDKYPYLAISIYNLIPCCSICNIAKSNLDTKEKPILYPYKEEFPDDMVFNIKVNEIKKDYVKVIQGVSDHFKVIIENIEKDEVAKNQVEKLHIDDLYNEHKSYIQHLLKTKYLNNPDRVKELVREFPELFKSQNDIKNTMYTKNIKKENWNKSTLAKLTHDIDQCEPK